MSVTPIHPSKLREPFTLEEIVPVIESWRGVPSSKVPRSVKLMEWLVNGMVEAVAMNEDLRCEIRGLERLIDSIHRRTRIMPGDAAGEGYRFIVSEAHGEAMKLLSWDKRKEAEKLAGQLDDILSEPDSKTTGDPEESESLRLTDAA